MASWRIMTIASAIVIMGCCLALAAEVEISEATARDGNMNKNVENEGYEYVGTMKAYGGILHWSGDCFEKNDGYLTFDRGRLGYVVITAHDGRSWTCQDYYEIKVGGHTVATDSIYLGGFAHDIAFDVSDPQLRHSAHANGVEVYVYRSGNGWKRQLLGRIL